MRATARNGGGAAPAAGAQSSQPPADRRVHARQEPVPVATGPISALGPLHRVLEGTVIDAVLTNRLDGSTAAPVSCLVTNPVYSHSGQHVLIPAGARVLGETRPVQTFGETRLAVAFHRLLMPDGSTVPLDQFRGLNQIGDSGLRDRVNHHYWSTFGAAAAVGLVSGLAQLARAAPAFGLGDGDRTVVIAGSAADATAQASAQVMNRFLNRLPTITIREGHRVKVYITSDLDLPEWSPFAIGRQVSAEVSHGQASCSRSSSSSALAVCPAHAQLAVIDPANLAQAVLIAQRAQRHYEELQAQYRTILRMSQGLGNLEGYRIPTISATRHDVGRWLYGQPWLQGLNSGDATGAAYWATTVPLQRPSAMPAQLTSAARRTLERQYATIEITDSVAMMGGHQVGIVRGYHGRLQGAVQELEGDVLNGLLRYHEMTAILDKVAAGELLGRRQDMASNQLLSHALEQMLARSKRLRDTEATTMNMQLVTWRDGRGANEAMVAGAADALRTWRQP